MASSKRAYYALSAKRAEMTKALMDVEREFFSHHESLGHAKDTIRHYQYTFRDFHLFLTETGRPMTTASLTTEVMREFATWIIEKPTRSYRGSTRRTVQGIHGYLKDMRAFVTWLMDEEIVTVPCKVPVPKQPQRFFRILTDDELVTLFTCRHLTETGPQAKRNLAVLLTFIDTGVRIAELAGTMETADERAG